MDKQYLLQTSGSQFHLHSQEEQYIGIALGVKSCNRSTEGRRTGVLYLSVVDLLLSSIRFLGKRNCMSGFHRFTIQMAGSL